MNQREFFDDHAETWDADRDRKQVAKIETLMRTINIHDNEFILDIGAGTGILFPFFKQASFIAIDISFKMLRKARQKPFEKGTLVQTDVCTLPFARGSFDRAVLFSVFPHIGEKTKALIELYDVLRPGGRIDIFHAASREAINDFHRAHGGPIEHDSIPDTPEMHDLLARSGYKEISIHNLSDQYIATAIK